MNYTKTTDKNNKPEPIILIIQVWECNVCDRNFPCRVEIHTSDTNLPEHLKGNERFRNRVCICNEYPTKPEWKRLQ
jgi:hypothetical protein